MVQCLVYPVPDLERPQMRLRLGLTGLALWLLAGGLTACAARTSADAGQLIDPGAALALAPAATATATVTVIARLPTRTSSPTPVPTATATVQPTPTVDPLGLEPTTVLTPAPNAPPAPDGVVRVADVPILMYHYISAAPAARDRIRYGLSVPPEMFEAQLRVLHDNGFKTVTLRDLYEYLATGKPLPERPIILTFDDGYVDNYTNAFPLLQKYGMIGTFFVLTGPADDGDPAYLSWDMIQEMSDAGMDIQLHGREHLDMRYRQYDWLVFHIIGGRQSIEGHTGKPVIFVAYPSGKYDINVLRFLSNTNFWAAVTTANGTQHTLNNALIWDRLRVAGQMSLRDFARLLNLNAAAQLTLPYPTATAIMTSVPDGAKPIGPTATPTSTARPPLTATAPRPTPTDLTPLPETPERRPPPTQPPSPLITPTPFQSPLITPMP